MRVIVPFTIRRILRPCRWSRWRRDRRWCCGGCARSLRGARRPACNAAGSLHGCARPRWCRARGDPVVLADDAERVGAVGEIGRQLVQERAGAEDFGCEIDGEVVGDGWCFGLGGWGRSGDRSRCRCGSLVTGRGGHGLGGGCGLSRCFRLDYGIYGFHGSGRVCNCGFNLRLRCALALDGLGFASTGVDATVVMPALAFSGS